MRMIPYQTYSSEVLSRFKICNDYIECLSQLEQNTRMAVAISYEEVRRIRRNSDLQFLCLKRPEIIHSFPMKFLVRKNFTHITELNEFIKAASASGLIEKFRSTRIQSSEQAEKATYGLVTFQHIAGGLLIFLCMLMYQFFIFFTEIVVHNQARNSNKKYRRFWIFIEMIINPKRHFLNETKLI